jgi:hypothetical protein
MAAEVTRGTMEGEGNRTVGTLDHLPALPTLNEGGIPSAIEEEDRLFGFRNPVSHGRHEAR